MTILRPALTICLACLLWLTVACANAESAPDETVLFLRNDDAGMVQLFSADLQGNPSQQLTDAPLGLYDYEPAPDGHAVALTWNLPNDGSEIWWLRFDKGEPSAAEQLLHCGETICQNPVWSHDNRRIVYERRNLLRDEPQLWWLDSETGATIPVFQDKIVQGYAPALSAESRYLSFVLIPDEGTTPELPDGHSLDDGHDHSVSATQLITIFDFTTGEQTIIPNLMNASVNWQANGDGLLFTDLYFFGHRIATHLLKADNPSADLVNLSNQSTVEDSTPRWSPDGSQIAFTRKQASTAMGRQLWLMDADGSNQRELTRNADWHHGEPLWSADGERLLFQRFDGVVDESPNIFLRNVDGSAEILLVENGFRPEWLKR